MCWNNRPPSSYQPQTRNVVRPHLTQRFLFFVTHISDISSNILQKLPIFCSVTMEISFIFTLGKPTRVLAIITHIWFKNKLSYSFWAECCILHQHYKMVFWCHSMRSVYYSRTFFFLTPEVDWWCGVWAVIRGEQWQMPDNPSILQMGICLFHLNMKKIDVLEIQIKLCKHSRSVD